MNRRIPVSVATFATGVATVLATLVLAPPAHAATEQLRFTFDTPPVGQVEPGPWTAGCFTDVVTSEDDGCIEVAGGGSVVRDIRPNGSGGSPALDFPAVGVGRALVRVPHHALLNPGTGDFTVTALVKLTADEISPGANVVQKGLDGTTGGQWKLQVDDGRPSCKIKGVRDGDVVSAIAKWPTSIADAGWSFITCQRRGAVLSVRVGSATPVVAVDPADPALPANAGMSIANTASVTIGAKSLATSNDQFHGALDNVVFKVD